MNNEQHMKQLFKNEDSRCYDCKVLLEFSYNKTKEAREIRYICSECKSVYGARTGHIKYLDINKRNDELCKELLEDE